MQQNMMPRQQQQQVQARTFPARNAPLTQSQDRPFSWEQKSRSRSVMSVPTSASSNVQRFPSGQLMQKSMQQGQGQVYQQREQSQSMKVMKPGLFHANTSPVYASNMEHNRQQPQQQQQPRPPQSPAQQRAIVESLQMARDSAEQQASHAKQENFKLMGKIENLERVFMQN